MGQRNRAATAGRLNVYIYVICLDVWFAGTHLAEELGLAAPEKQIRNQSQNMMQQLEQVCKNPTNVRLEGARERHQPTK